MNGAHHLFHGDKRALWRKAKVAKHGDKGANSLTESRQVLIRMAELLMERIPNPIGLGPEVRLPVPVIAMQGPIAVRGGG